MHAVEAGQVEDRPEGGIVVGMEEIGGKTHPMGAGRGNSTGTGWGNEKDVTRR
jgi:hypothetical protein